MEGIQEQDEMFPDIAKKSEEDLITERRKKKKSKSVISDIRKLGRYIGARQKEKKADELQNIRGEILEKK
ncbi:hypothetical protein A2662_00665 [Candidatus Giovannonibacteria bacterium RIFCSPHIGHO2_01_FULL_45_33]|uniref:Uncharacterized protein n=1 Tax=Candidatus Giovannonibacteria bacterium RIFCSPLOWO2_01_FULL_45_34 TaxID=1798351 RepID=A0A1F5WYV2_9BACT|nr:MAG: hypothetical protein A2662_00665 [Candidatus Giovannonibacteria bacterium RIFCSPHIGHO2_01_FULL_45_33]OGF68875.1 MAG: hypothetical protein A3C73_02520 [Candidatus Giovannonibacteria bacterium RIFCSPHIGHO2_02_FULL_44_11]OGF80836.1 MAG: hypothetical protein A2930_00480 [Candidatus Giovannonibacteria bacterium RIFCSPLOWO2_01_FULL_45_34]